jgi:predicted AAA+ superfamily ATPase
LGIDSTTEEEVDRTRQLLERFIEELYKVKREITKDMRTSFIQRTKAYQFNHQEWMDRLNTATKQKTLQALIPHLKNTKRFLSRLGDLHLDYRSQGQALALEIKRFLDFVAQTNVGANQPPHGGRVKHEYILLLVQLALFLGKTKSK